MKVHPHDSYKGGAVEWLAGVPSHWKVVRLRHLLRNGTDGMKIGPFGSQLTAEMLDDDGPFKVYGQENVIANDFQRGTRFISAEKFAELEQYKVQSGDLLVTMMGTSGRCAMVPNDIAPGIIDSHLLRIRLGSSARPSLVRLLIDSAPYVFHQVRQMGKGSIMHGLNSSIVKELNLLLPPLGEQDELVAFVELEASKIDALIKEQESLIALLRERRSALIEASVTGAIDVRGLVNVDGA